MSLNESKGNMYDFVTHTWNTVKGACSHDCSYCYMKRFGTQRPVRFDEKELRTDLGSGNFIFVGSSCDLFAEDIPEKWINATLLHCYCYDNKYLFQSKNPERMALSLIDHFQEPLYSESIVVCTTIETNRWYPEIMCKSPHPYGRAESFAAYWLPKKFITIEPIMDFDLDELVDMVRLVRPVQVNIGADSGHNNLPEPSWDKVQALIAELSTFTNVAKKRNLERLTLATPERNKS